MGDNYYEKDNDDKTKVIIVIKTRKRNVLIDTVEQEKYSKGYRRIIIMMCVILLINDVLR